MCIRRPILNALSQNQPLPKSQGKPFLLPMTFFMTEAQYELITAAFEKTGSADAASGRSQKRLNALCRMGRELSGEGAGMMFPCFFCAKQYRVLPLRR